MSADEGEVHACSATTRRGGLAERASASPWVAASPGLIEAVLAWNRGLAHERATAPGPGTRLARPGPFPPLRALRHSAALTAAQLGWLVHKLPGDLADGWRPLSQPIPWVQETVGYVIRDHLALLGPAAGGLARIIEEGEGLSPDLLVVALRRRPIQASALPTSVVRRVVIAAFGREVYSIGEMVSTTPITQLHAAAHEDGTPLLVRVRRPGIDRTVCQDARIIATVLAPFEWAIPPLRDAHPLGVVELGARRLLEEADLRNEARNTVELGLAIEELGIEGTVPLRPAPGLVTPTVAAFEAHDGAVALADGLDRVDRSMATAALVSLTLESALALGIFPADLGVDKLAVLRDGRLAITGCGTIGRLDESIRRGMLDFVMALIGSDGPGQVAALQAMGAVADDVDVDALADDLRALDLPDPMAILTGAEVTLGPLVRDGLALMVRHRLRPPVDLLLFVRALLSLRALVALIDPGQGLVTAMSPVLPRLAPLLAALAS